MNFCFCDFRLNRYGARKLGLQHTRAGVAVAQLMPDAQLEPERRRRGRRRLHPGSYGDHPIRLQDLQQGLRQIITSKQTRTGTNYYLEHNFVNFALNFTS